MQFSIITICRNDLSGLQLTYNSLFGQTFKDFEWIVIDGNSSDGTKEWLNSMETDNIKWISEPDDGIFDAMNKGIARSGGQYLLFMNSFDELAGTEVLNRVNNIIEASEGKLKFIYGDSIDIDTKGSELYRRSRHHKTLWRGMFTQHQAIFFRRNPELFFRNDYRITADYAYIGHNLKNLKEKEIAYINEPVCKFKLGGTNEYSRFRALKEDFLIRKDEFEINIISCYSLYIIHYFHTLLKKLLPRAERAIRYRKKQSVSI